MTRLLVLTILCLYITAASSTQVFYPVPFVNLEVDPKIDMEAKIVGGKQADIEKFPFAVQIFNYGALCGGSILSSWAVLTAAHCFSLNKNLTEIQVIAGAKYTFDMSAEKHNVFYFEMHENYNKGVPFACDIALVFVTTPFKFTNSVKKALLVNSKTWMTEGEKNFTATGWGLMSSGGSLSDMGLLEAQLSYVSSEECSEMHAGLKMSSDMFCLYGDGERDTCQGDSGGAILWNGLVVGVVSHGHGCAVKGKPGVYTNVYSFRRWIENKMDAARRKYCAKKRHAHGNKHS